MDVVVIGAGLAGLSAACHLRGAGHEVLVVEAGQTPGGRAGSMTRGGYRFDTGPTVLTMPELAERCFAAVGTSMDRHVRLLPLDLLRPLGPALRLVRAGAFGRLDAAVRRFFTDERLVRIFSFQSMYAGLAPQQALALYAVITYMDAVRGVTVPVGGMHALPLGLAAAAAAAGVTFAYGERVERIVLADGTRGPVRGVRLAGGDVVSADAVVCTADLPVAYRMLLPGIDAPRRARRGHYSPS